MMEAMKKIKNFIVKGAKFVKRAVKFIMPDGTDITGPYWMGRNGKKYNIYEEWFIDDEKMAA